MQDSYSVYWEGVKNELNDSLSPNEIFMWINRIEYKSFDTGKMLMTLSVPSSFIRDNVLKYKEVISDTLTNISGYDCIIDFIVEKRDTPIKIEEPVEQVTEPETIPEENVPSHEPPVIQQPRTVTAPAGLENIQVLKQQTQPQPVETPALKTTDIKKRKEEDGEENYSFASFIIGNSNEFAAHAARAVAENPGTKYNPYFIWGESGLGKTHLLKAVEKHVRENFPAMSVKYVSSEEFVNDFVNSIRSNRQEKFRVKYRQLDLLLIDDVQFFANKEGIQGEFFHTFNALYNNDKQMIFSCDQPIYKVKNMEARLKGRFDMGLTVDLRPPDFELRMAILKTMSERYNLLINNDALEYICTNIQGNIRELKGTFKDLLAYSSIMKIETITLDIAIYRLKEKIATTIYTSPISVDKIIQMVGEYFDVKTQDIIGYKRTKSIALARQIAMYLSRKLTRLSTTQIGTHFGNREHGTVMHATKKIEDLNNSDQKTKGDIQHLITKIKSD